MKEVGWPPMHFPALKPNTKMTFKRRLQIQRDATSMKLSHPHLKIVDDLFECLDEIRRLQKYVKQLEEDKQ